MSDQQQSEQSQQPKLDPKQYAKVQVDQTEVPTEIPSQGGGYVPMLPFGKYLLRLPANLAQLVEVREHQREGDDKAVPRVFYRFDKENPLVVVGGPENGHPIMDSMNNIPRALRDGGTRPGTLFFLLREGFADMRPIAKLEDWWNLVNSHAGQVFPAEIGGRATCDNQRVRYITLAIEGGTATETKEDPSGAMGCGNRYYTSQIPKDPATGKAYERFQCQCGASLRVFNQIERILKKGSLDATPAAPVAAGR